MDKLKTIIHTLQPEEQKEFSFFLQRQKKKKQRKDVELLWILAGQQSCSPDEMVATLYPESNNQVAYHALRKRLMKQLAQYISLKQIEEDPTNASFLMGQISLARYLFEHRLDHLAWEICKKAERLAGKHGHHDLLQHIYHLQIEHSDRDFEGNLSELIQKYQHNKKLADEDERASIANSLINHELQKVRRQGRNPNFDKTVNAILSAYDLNETINQRPRLWYQLINITRSAVLVRRDYYNFEPFIIAQYEAIKDQKGFSRYHHYYHLKLLYMIAHVLYRNKKFSSSLEYLDLLESELTRYKQSHYALMYPRMIMLRAANLVFVRRIEEAIQMLENLLVREDLNFRPKDAANARFNLGMYYFFQKKYQSAFRCGLEFNHSDKWLEKKLGREWVMRKHLAEIILQVEIDNPDLVLRMLRKFEKDYSDLLKKAPYEKVKPFLGMIMEMAKNPHEFPQADAYADIRTRFQIQAVEKEDLQEMNFYAWMKSKILGFDYYEVLLEQVERVS